MGGSQSQIPGGGSYGYHVLKVLMYKHSCFYCQLVYFTQVIENSPGYEAGLEAYFDFIVSINDIRMVSD